MLSVSEDTFELPLKPVDVQGNELIGCGSVVISARRTRARTLSTDDYRRLGMSLRPHPVVPSRTQSFLGNLVGGGPTSGCDAAQAFVQTLGKLETLDQTTQDVAEVRCRSNIAYQKLTVSLPAIPYGSIDVDNYVFYFQSERSQTYKPSNHLTLMYSLSEVTSKRMAESLRF